MSQMKTRKPPLQLSFDDDGSRAMEEKIQSIAGSRATSSTRPASCPVAEFYEVGRSARIIRQRGFRIVALQFPDELLPDAPAVVFELQRLLVETPVRVIVLGDTRLGIITPAT